MRAKIDPNSSARARYEAKLRKMSLEFNTDKDAEVIAFLDSLPNKAGYVKNLIKEDMEKQRNKGQAIACPFPMLYNKDIEI